MVFSKSFAEDKKYHVEKVMLHGNAHIPDDSVLYYLGLTTQRDYTKSEIDKMVKKAYDTGFFKKIWGSVFDKKKDEKIVVETKMTNQNLKDKDVGSQLLIDIGRYRSHPDCKVLVVFVYDKGDHVRNKAGMITDLERMSSHGLKVKVFIEPK
jgi:hypothetical protein